jgi:hypothetical protein
MQSLRLLLIAGLALVAVYVLPTPWALHIGGQFTPLESWSGYGAVQANNGGRYVLFIQFRGGRYASRKRANACLIEVPGPDPERIQPVGFGDL